MKKKKKKKKVRVIASKFLKIILLLNIYDLSIPDEGYSRNALCALNLISTFSLEIRQTQNSNYAVQLLDVERPYYFTFYHFFPFPFECNRLFNQKQCNKTKYRSMWRWTDILLKISKQFRQNWRKIAFI